MEIKSKLKRIIYGKDWEAKEMIRKEKREREDIIKNREEESYYDERYEQAGVIGKQKAKIQSQNVINELRQNPPKPYGAKGAILDLKKGLGETFGGFGQGVQKERKKYQGRLGQRNISNFIQPNLFSEGQIYEIPQSQPRASKPRHKKKSRKFMKKQNKQYRKAMTNRAKEFNIGLPNAGDNFRRMF